MTTEKRQINPGEAKQLHEEIDLLFKDINAPLKWIIIIISFLLTVLCAVHIYYYDTSNWSLISKFLVCVCPIIIWVTIELKYKGRKKKIHYLNELQYLDAHPEINILNIQAKRVMVFEEKDDEGTLYLIEDSNGNCMYLWDDQWLISEELNFPKQHIEVYLDKSFVWALSSKVNCYGDAVETLNIPGAKKWRYFKDSFPEDMEKPGKSFDAIIMELKNGV